MKLTQAKITVLISGNGSNLQALIDGCQDGRIDGAIHRVVSNRKAAYGLTRAHAAGIGAYYVPFKPYADRADGRDAYDLDLAERLNADHPDLIVLAGWMRILSAGFLATVNAPVINLHPALPGAYPGTNAIERAWHDAQTGIITETGVMVHRVIEEVDAGTVLGTTIVPIDTTATFETLKSAMHRAEHRLLVRVVAGLCQADTTTSRAKGSAGDP